MRLPRVGTRHVSKRAIKKTQIIVNQNEQCALIRGSLDLSSTDELWDCKLPRHRQTPTGAVTRLHVQAPEGDAGDHSSNPDQGEAVVPSPDRMTRMRAEPWPLIVGLATFAVAGFFAASVLGPRT